MKSCFFIGHREAPDTLYPFLRETIREHIIRYGVTEFVVGGYGRFDFMAGRAVISLKAEHSRITLLRLIPYHPAERQVEIPHGYDNTFYPSGMENVPRKLAIVRANRYMVDHTDYLIAYVWHPASNARNLVEYAQKKGKIITNLGQSLANRE